MHSHSQENKSQEWAVRVDCDGIAPKQCYLSSVPLFALQLTPKIYANFSRHVWHWCVAGPVSRVFESLEGGKKWIKVVFATEDEQKKALSMTRYSIGGTNIQVSLLSTKPPTPFVKPKNKNRLKPNRTSDTRRNLYVLNLPHDLSARRGFVVMSTHDEAQAVINWLDGVCIRGFQLRITWANIDRSNGFLSGYDRSTFSQNENSSMQPVTPLDPTPNSKCTGLDMDTSTIVASNIPSSLFLTNEMDILFKPFGAIKNIKIVPVTPSLGNSPTANPLSKSPPLAQTAIITYEKAADAITAKNTLHGQIYDGLTVAVGFVSNVEKDASETSHSICSTPFMPSTNAPAYQTYHRGTFPSLSPTENTFRGLPSAPQEFASFRYGTNQVPVRSSNWTSYTPLLPHNFGLQFQPAGNSLAFSGPNNPMYVGDFFYEIR
ncbi:hypothetical protein BU17DRAFT_66465 [Hysterangium stoloniferum]|nr:hypothetical protein BU17DRAFT_66465 [Hysterangium stoloniferum]